MKDESREDTRPVLVTGANGQIARQLFARLANRGLPGRGVVRSQRAAEQVNELVESVRPEVQILDYTDTEALTRAAAGCRAIVHLVGILKSGAAASYADAHENTCTAVARAAATHGLSRVVYLSIFGARADSPNACLASKGTAEKILIAGSTPTTVLRVPMVIGPDDPASRALRGQATRNWLPLIGGGTTIQQPLDIRDLLAALVTALEDESRASYTLDFGGPEALRHLDLVRRAGGLYAKHPRVLGVPLFAMRTLASVMERTMKHPPITNAMLGVLQHDDRIDNRAALETLGVELTPLNDTLARYIGPAVKSP